MRNKDWKYLLIVLLAFVMVGCTNKEDQSYADKWVGSWKTTDKMQYPLNKTTYYGQIKKVDGETNRVVVDGGLFDMNSSFQLPMKITSQTNATFDYTSYLHVEGSAKMNSKYDTITFYLTISLDNKTIKDTIIATK